MNVSDEEKICKSYINGLSIKKIALKEKTNRNNIRKILLKNKIKIRTYEETKRLFATSFTFSNEIKQIIDGELLGDGYIIKGINVSRFAHHNSKYEYSKYIANKLKEHNIPIRGNDIIEEFYNNRNYYKVVTGGCIEFHKLWNKWYNPKKIIPEDLKITPIVMLHWWMGDGSLRYGLAGVLCTDCFSKNYINNIIEKINKEIGIKSEIRPEKNKYHRIFIPAKYMKTFIEYIGNPPFESISYKWNLNELKDFHELIDIDPVELKELYINQNKSARELAEYYGCKRGTIYCKAKMLGFIKEPKKSILRSDIWKLENQNKIIDLYKNGKTLKDIVKITGFVKKLINFVLIHNNVKKYCRNHWLYNGRKK